MRIGIDARKLHDFGIGTYIRNLLRQLARARQFSWETSVRRVREIYGEAAQAPVALARAS